MPWLIGLIGSVVAGTYFAFSDGTDNVMFRTLFNFLASGFLYVLANVVDLFSYFLDFLPDVPQAGSHIHTFINYFRMGNTFFPVFEMGLAFAFVVMFLITFITIKFVIKLIPTIG